MLHEPDENSCIHELRLTAPSVITVRDTFQKKKSGAIPTVLGKLYKLGGLWLNNNKLEGDPYMAVKVC